MEPPKKRPVGDCPFMAEVPQILKVPEIFRHFSDMVLTGGCTVDWKCRNFCDPPVGTMSPSTGESAGNFPAL